MKEIIFSISADYQNVSLLGVCIRSVCASISSEQEASSIELCVVEAANNCIEHSYAEAVDRELRIKVSLTKESISIDITDDGKGMSREDFLNRPDEVRFDPEDPPEGGMGIAIMKSYMDEIDYSISDGINRLTMKKYLDCVVV